MKRLLSFIFLYAFLFVSLQAQSVTLNPTKVITSYKNDKTIPLRDMEIVHVAPGSFWEETDGAIPNKTHILGDYNTEGEPDFDPRLQTESGRTPTPILDVNIDGVGNLFGGFPPDTEGDIGPDHYIQMINLHFAIYEKDGTLVYGPVQNSTLWNGFTGPWTGSNDGDPVVLWDDEAERWLMSQFALPNFPNGPFYELIAISETSDPLGSWHRYAFQFDDMPDYPKIGAWPDGYYISINQFSAGSLSYQGAGVAVVEKAAMLNGDPAEMVFFDLGSSYGSLLPADADGTPPPPGTPGMFMNLRGSSGYNLWTLDVDWNNIANSTISGPVNISSSAYSTSLGSIPQPGTSQGLETLAGRMMFRLQYRNFGSYEAMVSCFSVNVGSGRAGKRWFELRDTGSGWSLYQEGTYAPDDGDNRWMGSIAMDASGNIALGYSVSSSSTYPSIRFTGRYAGDPLGQMTIDEGEIIAGNGSQTGSQSGRGRWGDYSTMSVDPASGAFWYTTEYMPSTSSSGWKTRIGSFRLEIDEIAPDPIIDLAVVDNLATSNSVHLTWTATGDDGTDGKAFRYDLRMSTSPITNDAQFDAATQIIGAPIPSDAGIQETFDVQNLDPDQTYHFAIKARDDQNNYSDISNPASGSTLTAPQIAVNPAQLIYNVEPNEQWSENVVVSNTTVDPSTLTFSAVLDNHNFPSRAVSVGVNSIGITKTDLEKETTQKGSSSVPSFSLTGTGGPDDYGYLWRDSDLEGGPEYDWIDISTDGTVVNFSNGNKDDGYTNSIPLGFVYSFYGTNYNSLRISTNGFVSFANIADSYRNNRPIPDELAPDAIIAAFWDDLDGSSQGEVYYKAYSDKFVVQFTEWQKYFSPAQGGSSGSFTFQIVIYENGKIRIYYNEMTGTLNSATVGIENGNGSIGLEVAYNSAYPPSNNFALQFMEEPEWISGTNLAGGTVWNGNSANIGLNFDTENLDNGTYTMDLIIDSNVPDKAQIIVPITVIVDIVPVELTAFSADVIDDKIMLNWETATETNNSGFEVQKMFDADEKAAAEWTVSGFVDGKGTTSEITRYSFVDEIGKGASGAIKYRLKQIDFDGTFSYSNSVEVEIIPENFVLHQNYPNPFNPSTKIEFTVPEESKIKLSVFNILGEMVAELLNDVVKPGHHEIELNASNLSSGVYIYRLEAVNANQTFVDSKRMILIK